MSSPHHVTKFAFNPGTGSPVILFPLGVLLTQAGSGEDSFADPNPDRRTACRFGTLLTQRTLPTSPNEVGNPGSVHSPANSDTHPVGANDRAGFKIDGELVLAEPALGCSRWLSPAGRVDVVLFESMLSSSSRCWNSPVP